MVILGRNRLLLRLRLKFSPLPKTPMLGLGCQKVMQTFEAAMQLATRRPIKKGGVVAQGQLGEGVNQTHTRVLPNPYQKGVLLG